jgi:hypothetical protein
MLATLAALAAFSPVLAVDKVEVTITTGADDLRGDSSVMVVLEGKTGRKAGGLKPHNVGIGAGQSRTVTLFPPANTQVADLHHLRVSFSSGRATGFDDHWTLDGIKVEAFSPGKRQILYQRSRMGTHLKYTTHWVSPFFPTAVSDEVVNPTDLWAEFEHGGDDFRPQSRLLVDFELEDGRFWRGSRTGQMVLGDRFSPGARVTALATDKFLIHQIRQIRVGFESGALTGNDLGSQLDMGDDFTMRGVRFYYKGKDGDKKELATFPEVNHRFVKGGWWQSPRFRPFLRSPGVPIGAMQIEVLNGIDDLRRGELPRDQDVHYNSRPDIFFTAPIVPVRAHAEWLVNGDTVRQWVNPASTSRVITERMTFPEGWEGRFGSWQKFSKVFNATGTPYFLTSDLFDVSVRFFRGQGGNLLPTRSAGGGIIGDFRQPDNWDLQGLIVTVAAPDGPWRRIYSDFGINRRMDQDRETWKSSQFETARLRARP